MNDRRPIGDLEMLHRGPTCLIGNRFVLLETFMPVETHRRPTYFLFIYIGIMKDMSVSGGSLIRHVGLQCVSDAALRWSIMSVSDGAYWYQMGLQHFEVSDQACRSPMGLRNVSESNNIFVNSIFDI